MCHTGISNVMILRAVLLQSSKVPLSPELVPRERRYMRIDNRWLYYW
jgi:hypothetical protein